MGPRLSCTFAAVALIGVLPFGEALADRSRQKAKARPQAAQSNALNLLGTYNLTSIAMRPVRDGDLAKSAVTFLQGGQITIDTACNALSTTMQVRAKPGYIASFGLLIGTQMGCIPSAGRAEAATARLFAQTANIARAGNVLTFLDINGANIAQWTRQAAAAPLPKSASRIGSSTQTSGAPLMGPTSPPLAVRVEFGDFVLSELGGRLVMTYPTRTAATPAGAPAVPEALAPTLPENALLVTSIPTLFLRANGVVMGSSSCNQYSTTLVPAPGNLKRFGPVSASKKACLNQRTTRLEGQLFSAIRTARRVDVTQRRIDLLADNGTRLARFANINVRANTGPSLYGTTWILRNVSSINVSPTNRPTIRFDGNQASGNSGCNQYTIQHNRQNGMSRFSRGVTTTKACIDSQRAEQERAYMVALTAATIIEVSNTTLTLRSGNATGALVFDAE